MSDEKNNGLVALQRWKFLLLLFTAMSFASLFSIVVMAEFMLRQDAGASPTIAAAMVGTITLSLLVVIAVVVCMAVVGIINDIFLRCQNRGQVKERKM